MHGRKLLLCLGVLVAAPAHASFMMVAQSAIYRPDTGLVTFNTYFNEPPDFFTVDQYGRQAKSFQYYVIGDPSLPYPERYDSIVRLSEITPAELPIRGCCDDDPTLSWGAIRGIVPYTLDGNRFSFSAPLSMLSDHSTDGHFRFEILVVEFGGGIHEQDLFDQTYVFGDAPEPVTAVTVAASFAALAWRRRKIRLVAR